MCAWMGPLQSTVTVLLLGQCPESGTLSSGRCPHPHQTHQEQRSQCVPARVRHRSGRHGAVTPKGQREPVVPTQMWAQNGQMAHLMLPAQGSSYRKPLQRKRVPPKWLRGTGGPVLTFLTATSGRRRPQSQSQRGKGYVEGRMRIWEHNREGLAGAVQEDFLEIVIPELFGKRRKN